MKFVGRFAYSALTTKPGMRKPRRDVLFGDMQYDIAELSAGETIRDAIVYESAFGREERLIGWDARLWSPMDLNGSEGPPTTAEDLKASCQLVYPAGFGTDNPITHGYFALQAYGPKELGIGEGVTGRNELGFDGEIVAEDRSLAIARFSALAREVVLIDGVPYSQRPEPHWRLNDRGDAISMTDRPMAAMSVGFRLDRLDDVLAYAMEKQQQLRYRFVQQANTRQGQLRLQRIQQQQQMEAPETRGSLIAAHPDFLRRDDLSCFFRTIARDLFQTKFLQILPFMPIDAIDIWRRHAAEVAQINPNEDAPYFLPTEVALDDFTSLAGMLKQARLPTDWLSAQEDLLKGPYRILEDHLAFEKKCGRLPTLGPADHEAIATMAL